MPALAGIGLALLPGEPANSLQIHVFDRNQPVPEHVNSGLALLEHDKTEQRLVDAILRVHFHEEHFIEDRTKPFDLDAHRATDFAFDCLLGGGLERDFLDDFQIPQPVRDSRKLSLAMKWLIGYSRERNEKSMAMRLAHELIDAAENRGAAVKKREDTHRMADANRAFAHYRW